MRLTSADGTRERVVLGPFLRPEPKLNEPRLKQLCLFKSDLLEILDNRIELLCKDEKVEGKKSYL